MSKFQFPHFFRLDPFGLAGLAVLFCFVSGCGSRADDASTPRAARPVVAAPVRTAPVRTALDEYVARPEPAYKWEKIAQKQSEKNRVTTLTVTSQTWQGIEWKHRVEIARPERDEHPGWALLYLSTTDSPLESVVTESLASSIGAAVVRVTGMPNQPLWRMSEDNLVAHTFSKFLQTNDNTWPLLLPMTKGAVKCLDATQEYSAKEGRPLRKFIVVGASKRGWTTWLVGATDTKNRIAGLIPLVYDNLNLEKQMPHQLQSWGKYSPMIEDYTRRGVQQQLSTPRGRELSRIVDPYTYRARLRMPKLLINGANDPYWTLDSLNLYWNDLPAPKNVYYAPNAGHSLEGDYGNVFGTAAAWFKRIASDQKIPVLQLVESSSGEGNAVLLSVFAGHAQKSRVWMARSANRDFRNAKWNAVAAKKFHSSDVDREIYVAENLRGTERAPYVAVFAETEFSSRNDSSPLRLSSPVLIWDSGKLDKAGQ